MGGEEINFILGTLESARIEFRGSELEEVNRGVGFVRRRCCCPRVGEDVPRRFGIVIHAAKDELTQVISVPFEKNSGRQQQTTLRECRRGKETNGQRWSGCARDRQDAGNPV